MSKQTRNVRVNVTSNVATTMTKGTVAAGGLGTALKGVGSSAALATGGIRAMTMALISSGIGAVVVAVGVLIAGFTGLVNSSRKFEESMSGLKAILGKNASEIALKELGDDAKRLGAETAFTATEVVKLQTEFSKLGFSTDEILAATEATLDLAAASGTDLSEAALVAGNTIRGFGLSANETQRVVDVMAKSFTSSALDMNKFQESMKLVAPIAKTVKVSIEESSAALAVLADRGISGSMAGTQLRRIMSDLAQKTGKDFQTSLEITQKRLEKASTEAEKLAIAKELVGDRAKGSLIALAENREQVDLLATSFKNAGGAAEQMAEDKLDNLNGDLTILGSAWSGLMLSFEDGSGIINKLSRGAIKAFTFSVTLFTNTLDVIPPLWNAFMNGFKRLGPAGKMLVPTFALMGNAIKKFALEAQLALADVPLLGRAIDEDSIKAQLSQLDDTIAQNKQKIVDFRQEIKDIDIDTLKGFYEASQKNLQRKKDLKAKEAGINEDFREGEAASDSKADADRLKEKKDFLDKLTKLEQDAEDITDQEKLDRKRERHLAELDEIVLNETEKREAVNRINAYYDGLIQIKDDEDKVKLDEKKLADDEKSQNEREAIAEEEERLRQAKIQGMYDVLDSAADVAGRESKIGKAMLAIKMAMQLKELVMKMKGEAQKLMIVNTAAAQETAVAGAKVGVNLAEGASASSKVGFPWNIISIASYALQAASMIKAFSASKNKMAKVTGMSSGGGSVGGASAVATQAPSFNVLGATSAGDNMIADVIGSANNSPVRAYVVESEVASAQSLSRNANDIASID